MARYFGAIRFAIIADSEEEAETIQQSVRSGVELSYPLPKVLAVSADEPVEFDEFGDN